MDGTERKILSLNHYNDEYLDDSKTAGNFMNALGRSSLNVNGPVSTEMAVFSNDPNQPPRYNTIDEEIGMVSDNTSTGSYFKTPDT